MTLTQKGKLTKDDLVTLFIDEFADASYENVSITHVCKKASLSKGQIYHYFESKDALYLECVSMAYDTLLALLNQHCTPTDSIYDAIKQYVDVRTQFGVEHPKLNTLFIKTHTQFPLHLTDHLHDIDGQLLDFNVGYFTRILEHAPLGDGLTKEDVLPYYMWVIEGFNTSLRTMPELDANAYTTYLTKTLTMMLYGTLKQGEAQ